MKLKNTTNRQLPHFDKLLFGALLLTLTIYVLDRQRYGTIYPAWYNVASLSVATLFILLALWLFRRGQHYLSSIVGLGYVLTLTVTTMLLVSNSLIVNVCIVIFVSLLYMAVINDKVGKLYLVFNFGLFVVVGLLQNLGILAIPKMSFDTNTIIPVLAIISLLLGAYLYDRIRQSKKLLTELNAAQEQMSAMFVHSPVATIIQKYRFDELNRDNLNVNPAFLKLFGYQSLEEVYALFEADPEQFTTIFTFPHLEKQIAAGEDEFHFVVTLRKKDGTQFECDIHQFLERDEQGQPYRFVIHGVDVTDEVRQKALLEQRVDERTADLQKANKALEVASKRKDAFLAMISHELRTPLNTILARAQALQWGVYGKLVPKQISSIVGIETSGSHLLNLIEDILDISKIEAGEIQVDFSEIDIKQLCTESVDAARVLANKKSHGLILDFQHNQNKIVADKVKLKQMLDNLLSNAIKFTPEGKQIGLIVSETSANEIQFDVWDEGIGIPADKYDLLFQPFVQIDNRLSRDFEGTGLGLALVKQLVDIHGGTIKFQSVLKKGSCFTVTIPFESKANAKGDLGDGALQSAMINIS